MVDRSQLEYNYTAWLPAYAFPFIFLFINKWTVSPQPVTSSPCQSRGRCFPRRLAESPLQTYGQRPRSPGGPACSLQPHGLWWWRGILLPYKSVILNLQQIMFSPRRERSDIWYARPLLIAWSGGRREAKWTWNEHHASTHCAYNTLLNPTFFCAMEFNWSIMFHW